MQSDNAVLASDAVLALAFIGDLSMGRPTDHSARTGWLAAQTVAAAGGGEQDCHHAHLCRCCVGPAARPMLRASMSCLAMMLAGATLC